MNRNMMRRVELAWPIEDADLRQRIIDECLTLYLQDNADAWSLNSEGQYSRVQPAKSKRVVSQTNKAAAQTVAPRSAQASLMALHGSKR